MPRFRPLASLLLVTTAALGGLAPHSPAQDLVGCQLTDAGQLQYVSGVSADPQSQIRALRQQISRDLQVEGAVQQQIQGLERLALLGQAREGQLITVSLAADALAALPASAFHWYRLQPGASGWLLITGAKGPSYQLQRPDVNTQLMLVVAIPSANGGSQRQVSTKLGPVLGVGAKP